MKLYFVFCSLVLEGKEQAVEVKCMDRLVELLRDQHTCVQANSTNAIMRYNINRKVSDDFNSFSAQWA